MSFEAMASAASVQAFVGDEAPPPPACPAVASGGVAHPMLPPPPPFPPATAPPPEPLLPAEELAPEPALPATAGPGLLGVELLEQPSTPDATTKAVSLPAD